MPVIERDVVLQGVDEHGNPTIDLPVARLGNIKDTAEVKETPGEGDFFPVIDGADDGQMKKAPWVSMQGPPGPQGERGPAGADGGPGPKGAPFTYEDFTEEQLAALRGPQGPVGEKGETGAQGTAGAAGVPGKSAYQYAVDGGYTGTEADFKALMGTGPWLPLGGAAKSAVKLETARTIKVNLASTSAVNFDGTANVTPGVSGALPIANGGTGATTAAAAIANLGGITIASNAGAHNSIFRGKYLGTSVTAAQYAAIKAGTFDDLFIGDYWTINGINWRIAAFDYYLGTGSTALATHHAVIVPDTGLDAQKMNDSSATTGGYVGSKMYTTNLATARSKVNSAFSGHVLSHYFYLSNTVASGKVTGSTHVQQDVVLMSERNVYGQSIISSECNDGSAGPSWYTYDRTQFPLFLLAPEFIQKERNYYWLRDVASASSFACVSSFGRADCDYASNSDRVRPAFSIS